LYLLATYKNPSKTSSKRKTWNREQDEGSCQRGK
jgi:hypothetical protein